MKRIHVFITGNVQGVFFRSYVKRKADELKITGWIKNKDDGSVEAVFEGTEEALEDILDCCRTGPRGAHVEDVSVTEELATGAFMEFVVK